MRLNFSAKAATAATKAIFNPATPDRNTSYIIVTPYIHLGITTFTPSQMVVGKNVKPALTRAAPAPRLPPVHSLKVKNPNATQTNPCMAAMVSVLGCWASHGYTTQGCAALEETLRLCVDTKGSTKLQKNRINTQLSRYWQQMKGPTKRG